MGSKGLQLSDVIQSCRNQGGLMLCRCNKNGPRRAASVLEGENKHSCLIFHLFFFFNLMLIKKKVPKYLPSTAQTIV